MDRQKLQVMRRQLEKALAEIKWVGDIPMQATVGKCIYGATNCTFKIEIAEKSKDGLVLDRHANELVQYGRMYGFEKDDLGKTFPQRGTEYKVTGLNMNSRKFPVLADRTSDGQSFKFPIRAVLLALGKTPAQIAEVIS